MVDASAVEVVVVDLVAGEHETVQAEIVNKHFLQFDALLSHVLVVDHLVWHFCIAASI